MGFLSLCIYAGLIYFLVWFIKLFFRQRGLPHGPLPYPLVGNLPSLYRDTHLKLDKMAKQYGPIFTLWFGRTPIVIVNDFLAAEEVFSKNGSKFSGRPNLINKIITKRLCRLPYMNYCPKFIKNQAICMNACNLDPVFLEKCISSTMLNLTELFEIKSAKSGFNPTEILNDAVMNLMSDIIYGSPTEGASFMDFNLPGNKSVFNIANATNHFRWLRLVQLGKYLKFKEFVLHREKLLQTLFDKQRECTDKTIMNMIIKTLNHEKNNDILDEAEILCSDMFVVSIEKIAAALNWMFLYFITWPEIQLQVYDEICSMKKKNGVLNVTVSEASSLPFLQAAVFETLRLSSFTPLSTIHETNSVVTLKGHKLPKGTCICVNLQAIHHSAKYWDEPFQFKPTRFLEPNSNELRNIETIKGYFPFGSGIRKCLGDELALKLLTTVMANLLLNFHFDISPWHLQPSLTGTSRCILVPQTFHITISKRK